MSPYPAGSNTSRTRAAARSIQRISGPTELVQAIPYLLGFHPKASLVLVGLAGGELVVTARLDLGGPAGVVADTIIAMHGGGTREIVAAVYADTSDTADTADTADGDDGDDTPARSGAALPWSEVAVEVGQQAAAVGCDVADVLLVAGGRWWSYSCAAPGCCPPGGNAIPNDPSTFAAAATYAGVVALPDRESLAAVLEPCPPADREALSPRLARVEHEFLQAAVRGHADTHRRSAKRAVFAAARSSLAPRWTGPPDAQVASLAVALGEQTIRDAVWMAVDAGRLDGRALWRDLARRLPAPYDAAPLFVFAWATWRHGDGALAGIAAERAVASDPGYSAADLLLAALARGVDPRRFPRLRLPRPA